jgi:hypothetical protein
MSTRFGVGALLLVVSLMLAVVVAACKQSAGNEETLSGWRNFVVVPDAQDSDAVDSIEEMERVAGFAFVFPSYLPEATNYNITLYAWEEASTTVNGVVTKTGPAEVVAIPRGRSDSPDIGIAEMAKPFGVGFPDWTNETEHVNIAETDVGCSASPSPSNDPLNPMLTCDWLVGERGFGVVFRWTVEQAIPGYVTEDMRQEVLKVAESMIVAPEHP